MSECFIPRYLLKTRFCRGLCCQETHSDLNIIAGCVYRDTQRDAQLCKPYQRVYPGTQHTIVSCVQLRKIFSLISLSNLIIRLNIPSDIIVLQKIHVQYKLT